MVSTSLSTTHNAKPVRRIARRRTADEARKQALVEARKLLLTYGPAGVTLKSVGDRLGHSHSTISHHFGSAEELQVALMSVMVEDLSLALNHAMSALDPGELRSRILVDVVFDAFEGGGAAVLAAWLMLSNKERYLEPVREAVMQLTRKVDERLAQEASDQPRHIPSALLFLTLCAFADALIGSAMRHILRVDKDAMRRLATQLIPNFV
jgi:AcrR family transcriptional regulator